MSKLGTRFTSASKLLVVDADSTEVVGLLASSELLDMTDMLDMAVVIAWKDPNISAFRVEGILKQLVDEKAAAFVVSPLSLNLPQRCSDHHIHLCVLRTLTVSALLPGGRPEHEAGGHGAGRHARGQGTNRRSV